MLSALSLSIRSFHIADDGLPAVVHMDRRTPRGRKIRQVTIRLERPDVLDPYRRQKSLNRVGDSSV